MKSSRFSNPYGPNRTHGLTCRRVVAASLDGNMAFPHGGEQIARNTVCVLSSQNHVAVVGGKSRNPMCMERNLSPAWRQFREKIDLTFIA